MAKGTGALERARAAQGVPSGPPVPPPGGPPAEAPKPWAVRPAAGLPRPAISAAELYAREYPPVEFAVAGLLGDGLTILGGKPKGGKSWLSLLLGIAVAGGHGLDGRAVRAGSVLYLALEDTERRLQSRLVTLTGALDCPPPARLFLHTAFPRANDGGLYHVAEWLSENRADARLVIVDTMARFRKPQKGNGNIYADEYEAYGEVKQLADAHGVAALVVHHTRKLRSEDPFEELSGSQAVAGAADAMWVLDRERGSDQARLYVTGRDVADATVPMTFEPANCRWRLGASKDGIDTDGRGVATSPAAGKLEQCKAWIRDFLKEYAYPSDEAEAAAIAAGFAKTTFRDAKVKIGKNHHGPLWNKQLVPDGPWWCGLGPPEGWKLRPRETQV